jgi:mannose-6-phosphate isomerase-like protein (cupin superfamily)
VYVVVTGEGEFVAGSRRYKFGPGDFLFVAAGVEHRFETFSPDLAVWVLFYGPDGGEDTRR